MEKRKRAAVVEFSAFNASAKKTRQMTVEARDFYSISYRYSGKISIKTDGRELISEKNSVTFVPKNLTYTTEIIEDMEMSAVHFKLSGDVDFRNPAVINVTDGRIRALIGALVRSYQSEGELGFRSTSMLYELFARLEECATAQSDTGIPKKILLAKERIIEGSRNADFSVSHLADTLGVSTAYLRREFSAAYGESPIAFLKAVRLSNAQDMLRSEYLTVAEIAEQCGFHSASYFIQDFRRATGKSPGEYRRGALDFDDDNMR